MTKKGVAYLNRKILLQDNDLSVDILLMSANNNQEVTHTHGKFPIV
jgi:hypothetical protein